MMTEEEVRDLQISINSAGYHPRLVIDGVFGQETQRGFDWFNSIAMPSGHLKCPATSELGFTIVRNASHYLNLYETKENAQWSEKEKSDQLRKELEAVGWQSGWAYCIAFVEAIWRQSYADLRAPTALWTDLGSKLCPHVMTSYRAFKGQISLTPVPGAIFFMQHGTTDSGHAGIVTEVGGQQISTIEGNTSAKAKTVEQDRQGDGIYAKSRSLTFSSHPKNLHLLGFLKPISW